MARYGVAQPLRWCQLVVSIVKNQTESILATISKVIDVNGVEQTLAIPIGISISKSPRYVQYPLTYLRSFNNRPTEVLHSLGPGFKDFFDPCEARGQSKPLIVLLNDHVMRIICTANAPSTTCPIAYDGSGQKITDSQGFCWYETCVSFIYGVHGHALAATVRLCKLLDWILTQELVEILVAKSLVLRYIAKTFFETFC